MLGSNKLLKSSFESLNVTEFQIFQNINMPRKVQYCMSIIHKIINEKRQDTTWLKKFIDVGGMMVMTDFFLAVKDEDLNSSKYVMSLVVYLSVLNEFLERSVDLVNFEDSSMI